eukprot:804162-Pelagomonas_calceolata.AAC.2
MSVCWNPSPSRVPHLMGFHMCRYQRNRKELRLLAFRQMGAPWLWQTMGQDRPAPPLNNKSCACFAQAYLQWRLGVLGLAPQVRGQETIGLGQSKEGGLDEVAQGLAGAGRGGVAVLNTSHLQHLRHRKRDYFAAVSGCTAYIF